MEKHRIDKNDFDFIEELEQKAGTIESIYEKMFQLDPNILINESNILYKSNTIKTIISPISMIAGYNQIYPKLSNINLIKWYGNENEINKIYQLAK